MNEIVFISDIHISLYDNKSLNNIIVFLTEHSNKYDEIYFLGDTFDFYFAYKRFFPKTFYKFLEIVKDISKDKKVFIMPGNHDIWLDEYFEEFGFTIIPSGYMINRFGKRILLMHGDELFLFKLKNRILNFILKNKINIFLFSLLHPNLAYKMGNTVSFMYDPHKSNDTLIETARREIKTLPYYKDYDLFILGHIHEPYYDENEKICITGDFKKKKSYVILNNKGVKFEHF